MADEPTGKWTRRIEFVVTLIRPFHRSFVAYMTALMFLGFDFAHRLLLSDSAGIEWVHEPGLDGFGIWAVGFIALSVGIDLRNSGKDGDG